MHEPRKIKIFDTTLRDGEQAPGLNLNVDEKLEIALQLEKLGVDYIEAGFPISSAGDFEAVRTIAGAVKNCAVVGLCRALPGDIDRAWEALRDAAHPRIHIFIASSDLHMEYKLNMTREQVLEAARTSVRHAAALCKDVQFSAEDATRSDPAFLGQLFAAAIEAGATTLCIADTVGYSMPEELAGLIVYLRNTVPGIENVQLAIHCHNDMGLAVANSLSAIQAGCTQIDVTINGLGERAGNTPLEELVMALYVRKSYLPTETNICYKQIYRTCSLVSSICNIPLPPNKPIVGANAFRHESGIHQHGVMKNPLTYEIISPETVGVKRNGIVLGKHSGRHAFEERLLEMGITLSGEKLENAFRRFKELADKKQYVLDRDIEALANEKMTTIPDRYVLEYYHITSGNTSVPTATVRIVREGVIMQEAACGEGPVDAVFKATLRACALQDITLEEYFLRAVTGGMDALGEVTVRIKRGKLLCIGRAISTDVIEASAKALIAALNRMAYEANTDSIS